MEGDDNHALCIKTSTGDMMIVGFESLCEVSIDSKYSNVLNVRLVDGDEHFVKCVSEDRCKRLLHNVMEAWNSYKSSTGKESE